MHFFAESALRLEMGGFESMPRPREESYPKLLAGSGDELPPDSMRPSVAWVFCLNATRTLGLLLRLSVPELRRHRTCRTKLLHCKTRPPLTSSERRLCRGIRLFRARSRPSGGEFRSRRFPLSSKAILPVWMSLHRCP